MVEAAASHEVLAVLEEKEREAAELQRLEVESRQRLTRFEFEDLASNAGQAKKALNA